MDAGRTREPAAEADETRTVGRGEVSFAAGDLLCERFEIVRFIARGGMGEVYEATDLALGERIALKTILPEIAADERAHRRFRREVQLARRVTHPNICRIFDLFEHVPRPGARHGLRPALFVTMELLHGETLAHRLRNGGRLPVAQARPIVAQLAAALAAAHAVGIVHRDFKSNNIVLLPGERPTDPPRVVVTDFGLAFKIGDAAVSRAGELVGTPDYMAPEQVEGGVVTAAADIYALGIVLYEMVTGARPYPADTPIAVALRRLSGPPARRPRELAPDLPVAWERTIMRCLARHPDARFGEATEVVQALVGAPARWPSARLLAFGVAAVLLLGIAGVVTWRGWTPLDRTGSTGSAITAGALAGNARRPSVAVLGFRNLAGRDDMQWLSVALAEMVTTELGAGEQLRTIPGENVNRMKIELSLGDADAYAPETLARIRDNLATDLVVFGSFVIVGEGGDSTVRVDVRLQDSRAGQTVSLVSETGRSSELLDLVSRAGARLRERLGLPAASGTMASVLAAQPSTPDATRLYAEGLLLLRRFDALGARQRFEQAVVADAKFPLSYSALANTWSALGYDDKSREAAERALALSTNLSRPDRLQVEGTYHEMANDWPKAIAVWQSLASSFPDDVEPVLRLANAQIGSGAARDGLATVEAFRRRFPQVADPRLDLAEAAAADTLSDFKRMQAAAAKATAAADAQGARLLAAAARLREGAARMRQGETDQAMALFEAARLIYAEAGDQAGVARVLNNQASAISDGPDRARVVALYQQGLTIARGIGEQDLIARFLNNLAIQERRSGNLQASLTMNQEALAIRREIGDRTNTAVSLNNIGNVLLDLGDPRGASQQYEQSAAMSREMGDRRGLARALHNAAESLRQQGEMARSRATIDEALAIRRGIDDPASLSTSLYGLGHTAVMQGDLATAKRSLAEALEMDRKLDRRRPMAYTLYDMGDVALVEGELVEARRQHQEALDMRIALGEKGTAAESQVALAFVALEDGRPMDAESLARTAATVFEAQPAPDNEALARAALALALLAQGQTGAAQREVERARTLRNPQLVVIRVPVALAEARVTGPVNPASAARALEAIRAEASTRGIPRFEFEARRALATVEMQQSRAAGTRRLDALKKDASARGYGLFAR